MGNSTDPELAAPTADEITAVASPEMMVRIWSAIERNDLVAQTYCLPRTVFDDEGDL